MDSRDNQTDLRLIYEDQDLVVVDKAPGLLSVPGRGPDKVDCVVSRLAARRSWVREAHRLDQATSGLMILALNPETHRRLSDAFANRRVEKCYLALVDRLPENPHLPGLEFDSRESSSGRIILKQRLDTENRPRQILDAERGKSAETDWRLLGNNTTQRNPNEAEVATVESRAAAILLELMPRSGRSHQLRLALALCGAPIFGDRLYGGKHADRLMLHARRLKLPHPVSGRMLTLEAAIPQEFVLAGSG